MPPNNASQLALAILLPKIVMYTIKSKESKNVKIQ